jgi:tetratricopeptide (TPR) repeat protein
MTPTLILVLLLQSIPMLPRNLVESPAAASQVPKKLQKDYDKIWARFLKGTEDEKVVKDADKLLKKNRDFVALIIVEAYIDLYRRRPAEAEKKLDQALSYQPGNRIVLSYLAELAFARLDYGRASDLYTQLLEADPSRVDVEPKRQKALLLAAEGLLQTASDAEKDNRVIEAELLYLQALRMAPREPMLHSRLGDLYAKEKRWEDALLQYQQQREFGGTEDETNPRIAEALTNLGRTEEARAIIDRMRRSGSRNAGLDAKLSELEALGRWGQDLGIFRQIQAAPEVSREQLAAMIVRYFPQIAEFRRTSQVITDIQDSWARPEIQTVVGIGAIDAFPNHTFQPAASLTRGELATALARLVRLLNVTLPAAPPVSASDVSRTNVLFPEIELIVTHGLMTVDESGNFNIYGTVSGESAVQAIERLLDASRGKSKRFQQQK